MPMEGIPATAAAPVTTTATTEVQTPTPEVKSPSPQDDPKIAAKFGALAKREKAILKRHQEVKELEARLAQREAELKQWEPLVVQAKQDPRGLLAKLGWDYNKLTEAQLKDFKPTPEQEIQELKQVIQSIKDEKVQETKAQQQQRLEAEKQALVQQEQQARQTLAQEIQALGDKYEFINLFAQHDLVFETMKENFKENGRIMSLDEACTEVETYLEEKEVARVAQAKKFQEKFMKKPEPEAGQKPIAITNKIESSAGQSLVSPKTDQERMQRALAALEGRR